MKKTRRRVSVVVVRDNNILTFRAQDPTSQQEYHFLPGGQIEAGETIEQTGIRETSEETGFRIEIDPQQPIVRRYDFAWDGAVHDCETTFLLGRLLPIPQRPVQDAAYHRGVVWIPLSTLEDAFSYHRDILEPILTLTLRAHSHAHSNDEKK
jgi:tRNA(adenine34) deaminase